MRITALTNGVERIAVHESGSRPGFQCCPPGSNKIEDVRPFEKAEEAARFLKSHPSWGIRMRKTRIPDERPSKITKDILFDGILR